MLSDKEKNLITLPAFRIFLLLLVLAVGSILLFSLFGANSYPYVHADIDSVYIFSSLSLLTGHTIEHNDHPGMVLHVIGILPVFLGMALIVLGWEGSSGSAIIHSLIEQKRAGSEPVAALREAMINGVIEHIPMFQQVFLGLAALLCFTVLATVLRTLYRDNTPGRAVLYSLCGLALMLPPTLGDAAGFNADFCAFYLAMLFSVSLLWERSRRNDLLTALFFALMVYTKATFAPLGLLMLNTEKSSWPRLVKWTAAWVVILPFLFWDLNGILDFMGFMAWLMISGGSSSETMTALDTVVKVAAGSPIQTIYIILFIFFGVSLTLKKGRRITGVTGLVVIIAVVMMSFSRPYKAEIYAWPVYSAGLLLTHAFISFYKGRSEVMAAIFAVLLLLSGASVISDTMKLINDHREKLEYHADYSGILDKQGADCLIESERPFFNFGYAHWLANAYSGSEYGHYLEELYEKKFGLDNIYRLLIMKDGSPAIEKYFHKGTYEALNNIPEGCYLSLRAGEEAEVLEKLSMMHIRPAKTLGPAGAPVTTLWKLSDKTDGTELYR